MLEAETMELIVSTIVGTSSYTRLMFYLYYFNSILIILFSVYSKLVMTYCVCIELWSVEQNLFIQF